MARNDDYSESDPTQYANYGGTGGEAYSEYDGPAYSTGPTGYGQTPPPPRGPWHQKPTVLVALGVLSAAILALLVFAVVKFVGSDSSTPAGTTATSSSASTAPATTESSSGPSTTQSAAPAPAPTTQTVTVSPTEAPTTTVAPTTTTTVAPVTTTTVAPTPSTTTSISTSVTTVTETTTQRWLPPILRPTTPTLFQPGQ